MFQENFLQVHISCQIKLPLGVASFDNRFSKITVEEYWKSIGEILENKKKSPSRFIFSENKN